MDRKYKRDKRSPTPKNKVVSKIMSSIKGTNTKPEMLLRKALFNSGIRGYRVNYSKLPGKPDIVYTRKKVAIFVNGCYWHGCDICGWKPPKHNTEYWVNKIERNKVRDVTKRIKLEELGYRVLIVWEHELKKELTPILDKIKNLLK